MAKFEARIRDYHGDDESSWQSVEAWDPEEAAKQVGQAYNEDDPGDPHKLDVEVEVRDKAGNVTKWRIGAYTDVVYTAQEVECAKSAST